MRVTASLLESLHACFGQVAAFRSAFPRGLTIKGSSPPADKIDRIVSAGLDVDWFAERVLTASALAEYQRVRASAYAEYERARAPAVWCLLADPANVRG